MSIYGYCRISTARQSIERQVVNIREAYPEAVIIQEQYTGTKIERPAFSKLLKNIKEGDTLVFDEVSRMSRNAADGFSLYKELYDRGIELVFLKEPYINTAVFKQTAQVPMVGQDVDCILQGVNRYLMILAEKQIEIAFRSAEKEVELLRRRTREGLQRAKARGEQIGAEIGSFTNTKKSIATKEKIRKYSKDFEGTLADVEVMKLVGVARNSYYKYKAEIKFADDVTTAIKVRSVEFGGELSDSELQEMLGISAKIFDKCMYMAKKEFEAKKK